MQQQLQGRMEGNRLEMQDMYDFPCAEAAQQPSFFAGAPALVMLMRVPVSMAMPLPVFV